MMINKEEYGNCCIDKQIIIIDLKKRLSNGQVSNKRKFEILVSKHKQVIQRVIEVDNRREKLCESLLNIKYSPLFFLLEEVAVV